MQASGLLRVMTTSIHCWQHHIQKIVVNLFLTEPLASDDGIGVQSLAD